MTHIIQQQHLHVEVNGTTSDGMALQHNLSSLCRDQLTPALERVLERCAPPNEHLCIEHLDINVGTLALDRLEHDLAEKVAQALEKLLREYMPIDASPPTIIAGNIQHKTASQVVNEVFIYFLKTGTLPWSFRVPAGSNLEQVINASWQEAAKAGVSPLVVNASVLPTLASATARKRLIQQFSTDFLKNLLAWLSPEGKKVMDGILQELRSAERQSLEMKYFARYLWEAVFANVATGKILTSVELISEAWRLLPAKGVEHTALASFLRQRWPESIESTESIPLNLPKSAETPSNISKHLNAGEDISEVTANRINSTEPIPTTFSSSEKIPFDISESPEEGIYIKNAGLVILHPFLPRFFETLGVVTENRLMQPERAICLLHFLNTGQLIAPEYELVLPKILCNVPLGTPVNSDVELTASEQKEAVVLLKAVIRHWEALRNTSPDGLRGAFLLRPGKVSLRDNGDWLLQVESETSDILLNQLPWGISMIKLPWMDKMLWVEWQY
jgi:hypothetical protein